MDFDVIEKLNDKQVNSLFNDSLETYENYDIARVYAYCRCRNGSYCYGWSDWSGDRSNCYFGKVEYNAFFGPCGTTVNGSWSSGCCGQGQSAIAYMTGC